MKTQLLTLSAILVLSLHAKAWRIGDWRGDDPQPPPPPPPLPTLGQVIDGIQNALPISPKSISCDQTRDDVGHHQKELNIELNGLKGQLPGLAHDISVATSGKNDLLEMQKILEKQAKLFADFQGLSNEQIANENVLKSTLWAIQSKSSDQAYQELLKEMQNSKNPKIKQVANFMVQLTRQSNKDLQALLENKNAQTYLTAIAGLISGAQTDIETQLAFNNKGISEKEAILVSKTQTQITVNARIQQIGVEYNQQEERKSCKP